MNPHHGLPISQFYMEKVIYNDSDMMIRIWSKRKKKQTITSEQLRKLLYLENKEKPKYICYREKKINY